jgi:hypothetical protein
MCHAAFHRRIISPWIPARVKKSNESFFLFLFFFAYFARRLRVIVWPPVPLLCDCLCARGVPTVLCSIAVLCLMAKKGGFCVVPFSFPSPICCLHNKLDEFQLFQALWLPAWQTW